MITARSNEVFPLKVRRRQIIGGNGESSIESVVPCARRGPETPLATCIACEHAEGLREDGAGRCSYLLCRIPPAVADEASSRKSMPDMTSAADSTPVAAAMTGNVVCVREDVSIETLTALFLDRGISGVPVVDAAGFPVGVVSKTDLVRERHENGESVAAEPLQVKEFRGIEYMLGAGFRSEPASRGTVGDIMTPLVFTLYEHSPISQAAALMAFEGVHRVPVVSNDGRVVGVLSSLDVMRWLAQHDGYLVRELAPEHPGRREMGARPIMLSAEATVAEIVTKHSVCAQIFLKHRIDFCCRGNVPVDAACKDRGLETSAVLAELEAAIRTRADHQQIEPQAMPTPALIDHIVCTHHEYLRKTLPFVRGLAAKVRRVHGEHNPYLLDLDVAVEELIETLIPHLDMEERELFPLLTREPSSPRVAAELATMHEDHLMVGAQLARIRDATENFRVPSWACNSYRTLFSELEHLEADIFEHVHLENHVLMPRFTTA